MLAKVWRIFLLHGISNALVLARHTLLHTEMEGSKGGLSVRDDTCERADGCRRK